MAPNHPPTAEKSQRSQRALKVLSLENMEKKEYSYFISREFPLDFIIFFTWINADCSRSIIIVIFWNRVCYTQPENSANQICIQYKCIHTYNTYTNITQINTIVCQSFAISG